MNHSTVPPRFVPTLTEVVQALPQPTAARPAGAAVPPGQLEAQILQRVMQRVDLVLERRLRETVGQLILEHTQTLAPRLREEIEQVVRESVSQALAPETAPDPRA
ncbi:hypothetical protein [Polaromonas sp.]|uniref:hypothetical protein n=1 Tax=Polaromonas sp. TaxID=1869339 RepID=UPI002FC806F2